MSAEADSLYAGQVLAAWATRYLPAADVASDDSLAGGPGQVVAKTFIDGFRTNVVAGEHRFIADEPLGVGGTDLGPTPYDLLSAALATRTTMTLKTYARVKKFDLRSATVRTRRVRLMSFNVTWCSMAN